MSSVTGTVRGSEQALREIAWVIINYADSPSSSVRTQELNKHKWIKLLCNRKLYVNMAKGRREVALPSISGVGALGESNIWFCSPGAEMGRVF